MLGPAPVVDFDGTLARLDVDWAALRTSLDVRSINDLWPRADPACWREVTAAELAAATRAEPVVPLIERLDHAVALAVLTSNSEASVAEFLRQQPAVAAKVVHVVGRETLAGPKDDPDVFARGFLACVDATAHARAGGPVIYVGDMSYELELARALGATAVDVADLDGAE